MKKVIFSTATIMLAAVAMAQSDSGQNMPLPILGGPQEVVTNISTSSTANRVETNQFGNSNKVNIAQAGTIQSAYVSQDNGSTAVGANLALIQQTGAVTSVSGEANIAEIKQSGETNAVGIGQQGDLNSATAYQGQGSVIDAGNAGSKGNVALIQQGTGQNSEYNAAETYQDGSTNFAGIKQTYDRNAAVAIQSGDLNNSSITQDAGPNLSDGHIAGTLQDGNRNNATIAQSGTAMNGGATGRSIAATIQMGDDNASLQMQNSIANEGDQGERAIINQGNSFLPIGLSLDNDGSNGTVYSQLEAVDSTGDLDPSADGSFGGIAVQIQTGKMNAGEIHQFGSANASPNSAQQNQSGWNQEGLIVQNSNGIAAGGGNWAFQDQRDDNNVAAIGQNGFDNKAQQKQNGKRNDAYSTQRGEGNKVSTTQTGNNSRLETLQNGSFNRTLISQTNGQSALVSQNRGEYGTNGRNEANIYQTDANGDVSLQGVNCNFESIDTIPEIIGGSITIGDICPDCD